MFGLGSDSSVDVNQPSTSTNTPTQRRKRRRTSGGGGDDWTEADEIPDILVYSGTHGVKQQIGIDQTSEPIDFFSHFVDEDLMPP